MRQLLRKLYPPDDDDNRDKVTPGIDSVTDDDGRYWYHFSSNGKNTRRTVSDGDYTARKIDGTYYCFDEDGHADGLEERKVLNQ